MDYLITVRSMPPPGGKADAEGLCVQGGGPVPNALIALSRLGVKTALIAAVGDDLTGDLIRRETERESIRSYFIIKKGRSSDSAYGFVEAESGRRTIALCRKISINARDLVLSRYPLPRAVHLDGRDLEACIKLARWGRKAGARIMFDIGSIRNDVSPIFPLVDHLVVSDVYALGFTGKRSVKRAIKSLAGYCPGSIVVTEGIEGATGFEDGVFYRHAAFRIKAVDTTGAGDSFHAGYLYGHLKGFDMTQRLRYGCAVAALKCAKPGARTGNPTLRQLTRFLKRDPETYA
jgi:sugar/nucleoside kinase (ribokinase family)